MNEQPTRVAFREGFVDDKEQPKKPEVETGRITKPTTPPVLEASPAETEKPAWLQDTWPLVYKLQHSKNLKNDRNETVDQIAFREPRGGDIARYGNPFRYNSDMEIVMDERKMHFIMSALCGITPPNMEAMDPRDWNTAAWLLRRFFLPDFSMFLPAATT